MSAAGAVGVPLTMPPLAPGLGFSSQAAVLDSGIPAGFALTDGVELTFR